jgi:hypothetical protein
MRGFQRWQALLPVDVKVAYQGGYEYIGTARQRHPVLLNPFATEHPEEWSGRDAGEKAAGDLVVPAITPRSGWSAIISRETWKGAAPRRAIRGVGI